MSKSRIEIPSPIHCNYDHHCRLASRGHEKAEKAEHTLKKNAAHQYNPNLIDCNKASL